MNPCYTNFTLKFGGRLYKTPLHSSIENRLSPAAATAHYCIILNTHSLHNNKLNATTAAPARGVFFLSDEKPLYFFEYISGAYYIYTCTHAFVGGCLHMQAYTDTHIHAKHPFWIEYPQDLAQTLLVLHKYHTKLHRFTQNCCRFHSKSDYNATP